MTIEYAVSNLNGNIESETMFILDSNFSIKNMDVAYVNKIGKIFFNYKDIKPINSQRETSRLYNTSPINVIKTFANNTDDIFKRIYLN